MNTNQENQPYERTPKESAKAFEAFTTYANQGPQRSLVAVGQALGKSGGLIERWSRRYDWVARARAFDAHVATTKRLAEDQRARQEEALWEERKREVRTTEWSLHKEMIRASFEALKRFLENARRGAPLADIARLAEVADHLGRLAVGLPTDRTEVTGPEGGPIQIEVSTALTKIYGEVIELTGDSHAGPAMEDGQILLLPRGDCTDAPHPPGLAPPTVPPTLPTDSNPKPPTP